MNSISNYASSVAAYADNSVKSTSDSGKSNKTIGKPQLSEKASKYYEELKKKYSNMDFILVSTDQKEQAKAQAASYANANKMVVLIDEEKIEKMAEDENFRKQYEGIIANAASGMAQLGSSLNSTGATVKGFGMQVNDNGTASYFAVLEKSSAAQRERIEKKAEEKKEAKKAARKKAEKEEREERLKKSVDDETVTIQANSIEELLQKIQDYSYSNLSDSLQTAGEKQVGQKIDFSV